MTLLLSVGSRLDRSPTGANNLPAMQSLQGLPNKPPSKYAGKAVAKLTDIRMSVKKINVVAKLIRRMHIDDALIQLALLQRKAARILTKVRASVFVFGGTSGRSPQQLYLDSRFLRFWVEVSYRRLTAF